MLQITVNTLLWGGSPMRNTAGISISFYKLLSLTFLDKWSATKPENRHDKLKELTINRGPRGQFPTIANGGVQYTQHLWGVEWGPNDVQAVQKAVWNRDSFLPNRPAQALTGTLKTLSDISKEMAIKLQDNTSGLLAENELRNAVSKRLNVTHLDAVIKLLTDFKAEKDAVKKIELGQQISDVAFHAQWLIRGVLFEGKLHGEKYTNPVVKAPLSIISAMTNAALGRRQLEFVYDDYTLKAGTFPDGFKAENVDYNDPKSILDAIAGISETVGFCDMAGAAPEQNFRHNHTLMELQMRDAFAGYNAFKAGDIEGLTAVVSAAERAHKIFKTMTSHTRPKDYPDVRLMIQGTRSSTATAENPVTVYPEHGVFYEGVGTDVWRYDASMGVADPYLGQTDIQGAYVKGEWGQTGANSSMFKWFDIIAGVADVRSAYDNSDDYLAKMKAVLEGRLDSAELKSGADKISAMQNAFDLFTRPDEHLDLLVELSHEVQEADGFLKNKDPKVLMKRFEIAYWVSRHRNLHLDYVEKMIYDTKPKGGQSKAGTGGSTVEFLPKFFRQTADIVQGLYTELQGDLALGELGAEDREKLEKYKKDIDMFTSRIDKIEAKGKELTGTE